MNANLETKRRKRVQRNVVAAVIPAFVAAMFSLSNSLYGKNASYVPIESLEDGLTALARGPMSMAVGTLAANEWLFPLCVVLGLVWVGAFSGVNQPSERRYLKGVAQAAAIWGPIGSALSMASIAAGVIVLIILLFRV